MPILTWLTTKITGEALKAGGEAIKTGTEVAKTATEIPKNIIETEKAKLEVAELKRSAEERERLITPATWEDVKEFGNTYQEVRRANRARKSHYHKNARINPLYIILVLVLVGGVLELWGSEDFPFLLSLERAVMWIGLVTLSLVALVLIWAGLRILFEKIRRD